MARLIRTTPDALTITRRRRGKGFCYLDAGGKLVCEAADKLRFKALGVTTLLTLESPEMYSTEKITDRSFSPISDNLIALRYAPLPAENRPTLTIVKTRGSWHDFGNHPFSIGKGGLQVGAPAPSASGSPGEPPPSGPSTKKK